MGSDGCEMCGVGSVPSQHESHTSNIDNLEKWIPLWNNYRYGAIQNTLRTTPDYYDTIEKISADRNVGYFVFKGLEGVEPDDFPRFSDTNPVGQTLKRQLSQYNQPQVLIRQDFSNFDGPGMHMLEFRWLPRNVGGSSTEVVEGGFTYVGYPPVFENSYGGTRPFPVADGEVTVDGVTRAEVSFKNLKEFYKTPGFRIVDSTYRRIALNIHSASPIFPLGFDEDPDNVVEVPLRVHSSDFTYPSFEGISDTYTHFIAITNWGLSIKRLNHQFSIFHSKPEMKVNNLLERAEINNVDVVINDPWGGGNKILVSRYRDSKDKDIPVVFKAESLYNLGGQGKIDLQISFILDLLE